MFFFRDAQKHEVDFTGPLMVECKWKNTITGDGLHPPLYYMKKKNLKRSVVVGKEFDVRKYGETEVYIPPLPLFLLLGFSRGEERVEKSEFIFTRKHILNERYR